MKNELYGYDLLPIEEYEGLEQCQEDTGCYDNGEWILDSFYNGNWGEGVDYLIELCVLPREFAEYIEDKIMDYPHVAEFLDRSAFCTITKLWYERRFNEK